MTARTPHPRPPRSGPRLLDRLGLGTPEVRAWALYDVGNSAAVTSIVTAIFPIYFARVAAADLPPTLATQRYALATTLGLAIVAGLAPLLGSLADVRPVKKLLLGAFAAAGATAVGALFFVGRGDWLRASSSRQRSSSCSMSVSTGASSSTTRSCPTSPGARTCTGSPPPATPWGIWAAESSSRLSSPGSPTRRSSGSRRVRPPPLRRRRSRPGSPSPPWHSGGSSSRCHSWRAPASRRSRQPGHPLAVRSGGSPSPW